MLNGEKSQIESLCEFRIFSKIWHLYLKPSFRIEVKIEFRCHVRIYTYKWVFYV